MCSQGFFKNDATFKVRGVIKILVIFFLLGGWGKGVHVIESEVEKENRNIPFSGDIILKQNYVVMLISLLSLVNICQNYIGLY